jgi:hypothetical protein
MIYRVKVRTSLYAYYFIENCNEINYCKRMVRFYAINYFLSNEYEMFLSRIQFLEVKSFIIFFTDLDQLNDIFCQILFFKLV